MTLESDLAKIFKENGWTWKVKGRPNGIIPDEDDIEAALDEAARILHNQSAGAQLHIGRLIVVKQANNHDVYVFTGTYQ